MKPCRRSDVTGQPGGGADPAPAMQMRMYSVPCGPPYLAFHTPCMFDSLLRLLLSGAAVIDPETALLTCRRWRAQPALALWSGRLVGHGGSGREQQSSYVCPALRRACHASGELPADSDEQGFQLSHTLSLAGRPWQCSPPVRLPPCMRAPLSVVLQAASAMVVQTR